MIPLVIVPGIIPGGTAFKIAQLLEVCRSTILKEGRIGPNQYELLRAVSEAVDVPMPPLSIAGPRGARI